MQDKYVMQHVGAPSGDTLDDAELVDKLPDPPSGPKILNGEEMSVADERMLRMANIAAKFASTLSLKPINAEIVSDNNMPAPAWSDAENIYFNEPHLGDITDPEVVVSTKGLILHETAHIMLTPRAGSKLVQEVKQYDMWRAFNALEDMRIETFMTARFSNVDDWLVCTIAQHLLKHPNMYSVAFPIIHGRKYLPLELRQEVSRLYENPLDVAELSALIDEYITMNLADTKKYVRAFEIIKRYHELVENIPNVEPNKPYTPKGWNRINDPNAHEHRGEGELKSSSNKPMSKSEQDGVIARVMRTQSQRDAEEADAQANSDTADQNSDSNPNESTEPGQGAGQGGETVLKEMLKKQVSDVLKRRAKEIRNNISQLTGEVDLNGKPMKAPKRSTVWNQIPSTQAVQAVRSFVREIQLLKAEHDPGWNKRVEHGKLNVHRYAMGCEVDEAFDEWDLGREDATDIECFIALDVSPSMSRSIQGAYESMWAVKRSLDKIGASTTVVTFANVSELLYSSDERAGTRYRYGGMGGGTEPLTAIQYGRSVLGQSKRSIKVFIAITDGAWWDAGESNKIIKQLRKAGIVTGLAYISGVSYDGTPWEVDVIDSHGCATAVNVTNMSDLFKLAKALVRVGIVNNLNK